MTTLVCAAGIDVGRDHLDVAIAPAGRARRVTNEAGGIASLVRHLRTRKACAASHSRRSAPMRRG